MPATIQLAIRKVHGPSLEADEDVAVLTLRGLAPDGTVMDPAWIDRWRAAAGALGFTVGSAGTPEAAAAVTVEACIARISGRPPGPVRAGRAPGEFVLPDVERAVAVAAMQLGVGLVDLTRGADLRHRPMVGPGPACALTLVRVRPDLVLCGPTASVGVCVRVCVGVERSKGRRPKGRQPLLRLDTPGRT